LSVDSSLGLDWVVRLVASFAKLWLGR